MQLFINHFGGVHAGPLHKEKGILYSDIDVSLSKASRRRFDATGHYARPDVFNLTIDKSKKNPLDKINLNIFR